MITAATSGKMIKKVDHVLNTSTPTLASQSHMTMRMTKRTIRCQKTMLNTNIPPLPLIHYQITLPRLKTTTTISPVFSCKTTMVIVITIVITMAMLSLPLQLNLVLPLPLKKAIPQVINPAAITMILNLITMVATQMITMVGMVAIQMLIMLIDTLTQLIHLNTAIHTNSATFMMTKITPPATMIL